MDSNPSQFIFVVCQAGAEPPLKAEFARQWPDFRFAFSRPGFATFKVPASPNLPDDFDLRSTFARTYGFSIGKLQGTDADALAGDLWRMVGEHGFHYLHVWQRDERMPGDRGFEPGVTALAQAVAEQIAARQPESADQPTLAVNRIARAGQMILDCVLVEPHEWWVGYHRAASLPSCWPGGVFPVDPPEDMISRAYLKVSEALAWSRLPVQRDDACVEIGSSPGGASQALLERGLHVIGIDPAEMDESLLEHPRFTHVRKRAADVKRREFRGVKWLLADSNVTPQHTLDSVESIVTHDDVNIRGMLLTLKLSTWELAPRIAECIERIRGWGYEHVKARQLAFNRREVCVVALRRRSMRRLPPRRKKPPRPKDDA